MSILLLAVACGGSKGSSSTTPKQPLTPKDIVQQSSPAIVRIEVGGGDVAATGTGFIVDGSGLIATNFHVVRGNRDIRVKLYGGDVYPVAAIAGIDPGRDLALLRIQSPKKLPAVRLGDSDAMSAGDQVIAIGNPLGVFDYSVSSGLVSQVRPVCTADMVALHRPKVARLEELLQKAKRSQEEELEAEQLARATLCSQELTILQISAPISQGSSGGPLFNEKGEVVGVTTAIITAGQNINLAIPGNYLKPMAARPEAISLDEFAKKTSGGDDAPDDGSGGGKIERLVPDHPLAVLDGCKREEIAELVASIWQAIEVGAPLYNQGNHEACYRIYEGTATKYEKDAPCKGVKTAFADGLLRASTLESYKLKAWAMRDTFDGLLGVADRWAAANNQSIKPPKKKK